MCSILTLNRAPPRACLSRLPRPVSTRHLSCGTSSALPHQGKRSSKGLPEPILPDPLITVLIGELDTLVCAIVKYTSVIQRYYIEYLKGAHLTSLRRLIHVSAVSAIRQGATRFFSRRRFVGV